MLEGYETDEIAKEMGVARRTIKAYFNRMYLRFQISGGVPRVKLAVMLYREQRAQERQTATS